MFLPFRVEGQEVSQGALEKSKPTIYIEHFNRRDLEMVHIAALEQYYWLRLYNNSRWGIRIDMSGGLDKKLGDVKVFYDVIQRDETLVHRSQCKVCSTNILKPGKSLIFGVARGTLPGGASIRLGFSFEWENDIRVAAGLEPRHYVFFELIRE